MMADALSSRSAPQTCRALRAASRARSAAAVRRCCVAARPGDAQRAREEAAQQRTMRALDAAVQGITRMLSVGDMFGSSGGPPPRALPGAAVEAPPRAAGRTKRVGFRARARASRQVPQAPSARLLDQYLSLPAEEYNLLDPAWVTRLDETSFRFTLPLASALEELMMGAPAPAALARLVPAITVRTSVDSAAQRVTLRGSEASLGNAESDATFGLGFETCMTWSGGPPPGWSYDAADVAASSPEWGLACEVRVEGELTLPAPLSALPRPVLSVAGSLFAKAVAQAVLPRFAEALAADYARWAVGKSRDAAAGSLLPLPAAAALPAPEEPASSALVDV